MKGREKKKEGKIRSKAYLHLVAGSNYLIWIMSFKEINY